MGRRFRAATGYRPIESVHAVRIEEVRRIIEMEAAGLDDVGYCVGYEDPAFFRRLFKRETGLSPAAYRRKMAGKDPASGVIPGHVVDLAPECLAVL